MMTSDKIRPLALAVIRRSGQILVSPGFDKVKNENFYRLLGGGVEFGETSQQALAREMQEELAAEIKITKFHGVLENIFSYLGQKGHEICFIYEAEFIDQELYKKEELYILDATSDDRPAIWVDEVELKKSRLYPEGVGYMV